VAATYPTHQVTGNALFFIDVHPPRYVTSDLAISMSTWAGRAGFTIHRFTFSTPVQRVGYVLVFATAPKLSALFFNAHGFQTSGLSILGDESRNQKIPEIFSPIPCYRRVLVQLSTCGAFIDDHDCIPDSGERRPTMADEGPLHSCPSV